MTMQNLGPDSRLSADLEALHARVKGRSLTLEELKRTLKGRGASVLLVLLALPFCFVAIPGLSTPFGIAICLIGACLVQGREPWLPRFVMRQRLSAARSSQLLSGSIRIAHHLEKFVRPRLALLHTGPTMLRLIGLGIVVAGIGLMLPLPIPFSNSIPAWAVVFLAVGLMERDGLCILLGHLTVLGSWIFIAASSLLAVRGFQELMELF